MRNPRFRRAQRLRTLSVSTSVVSQDRKLETYKLVFDLLKHLTTLSSGSILLLVTLFEKVFKLSPPGYQLLLAFGGFFFSIVCSVVAMLLLAFNASDGALEGDDAGVFAWMASFGWCFFAIGMLFTLLASAPSLV